MPRALWKGAITFGLVNIPVELYSAEERKEFKFSMLDKRDFSPVGYKRYSKESGKEVESTAQTCAGTVLIVDDEDVVRRAARATLEHYGYTVFEASDGRDGTDLFSRLHDRISLVLLDLTMPAMDGHAVWRFIRRIRPDMKIVISSGFDESEALKQFTDDPGLEFIQKPYTASSLVRKVRSLVS